MKRMVWMAIAFFTVAIAQAHEGRAPASFYRDLTLKLRPTAEFRVPVLTANAWQFKYQLRLGQPAYDQPIISDTESAVKPGVVYRLFWDRVLTTDESFIEINGEKLPLTCVFISGQDNRYSGHRNPKIPEYILRVYLVANDYTCDGPIKTGWPQTGGRKEAWDTYVYYEIHDPTIMLPVEAHIRYRWTEFPAVLIDRGPQQ